MKEDVRLVGIPHRSNGYDFEKQIDGAFWQDLLYELEGWLEDVHLRLEDGDGMAAEKALNRLGGNAEAIRNFVDMPRQMLANLKADREED